MKVLVVLVMTAGMAFMGNASYGDVTTKDFLPVLEKVKAEVSSTLADIDQDLTQAAKTLATIDRTGDAARDILRGICKGRPYVYDCAVIDRNGKLSVVEPASAREYEGRDISFERQVKDAFATKRPLLSKAFRCLDGSYRVDFEYPIVNDKGGLLGSVSLLVDHAALLREIVASSVTGQSYKVWAMETDGMVLYDQDRNQINKNVFSDPLFAPFKDLLSFCRKVAEQPSGEGQYEFYRKGLEDETIVKKDAVWDTVDFRGTQWRIVALEVVEQ